MANGAHIAGAAVGLAACGLQIAQMRLMMTKGEYLRASGAAIRTVETSRPEFDRSLREQYLESALAAEQERARLYAEQSIALDRYFIDQSYLLLIAWALLFVVGLGLVVSSRRASIGRKNAESGAVPDPAG